MVDEIRIEWNNIDVAASTKKGDLIRIEFSGDTSIHRIDLTKRQASWLIDALKSAIELRKSK